MSQENRMETKDEQARLWNGLAGAAWVDAQAVLDRMYQPFEELLVDAVRAAGARRVLDVGCGTGATTVAAARAAGAALGVDVSEPMIAAARARAEGVGAPARFVCADAQVHAFDPASFDMIVSRFGVMFFADPVQAFANLRRAASPAARLRFVAWRSATENPFMTTAERAAAPLLPSLPPRRPDAPGQFGFASAPRIVSILQAAGWAGVDLRPVDVECSFPEPELIRYLTRMGPVGQVLHEANAPTRTRVVEVVRPAFEPFVRGSEVRFTAACWMASAST
jgi:SAM-dependent methyltransferase